MIVHRASTGRGAVSLAIAAALTLGTEGHVLAAMQPATGPSGQVAGDAAAQQPTAAQLSGQAIERFKAKDYDAAARLFEQAYGLDRNPNYLFNIGRVYEEKGDIRAAVDYYQRFIKEPGVELQARDLALSRLKVLKAILHETEPGAKTEPEPAPAPAPAPEGPKEVVAPTPAPPPVDPDPQRKVRLAGLGLVGVGGVTMIAGAIVGGITLAKQDQLADIHDYDARRDLVRQGNTLALTTDVLLGVGGGLVLTGAIMAIVATVSKRRAAAARRASVSPAGLGLTARF